MVSVRRLALSSIGWSSNRKVLATLSLPFAFASSFQTKSFCASTTTSAMASTTFDTGYLDAVSAAKLDEDLMTTPGFTLEQLMELAGLSVAEAVYTVVQEKRNENAQETPPHVLIVAGPGNNGGDGLVAARHLVLFGYQATVVYPKRSSKQPHYENLVKQCNDLGIAVVDEMPKDVPDGKYTAIVDAIFGFSFTGEPREPFASILKQMITAQQDGTATIISVDVPSGWNVDEGDVAGMGFLPDVLVSLTAPKLSAKSFPNRHFVGGRFLPPAMSEKYGISMPPYPGVSQVMEITKGVSESSSSYSWEKDYAAHLAEKEAKEFAAYAKATPSDDSWESQYQAYLNEKEEKLKEEN